LQYISRINTLIMHRKAYLILTMLAFVCFTATAQDKGPKIEFDKMIHDFGTVQQNDPTQTVFSFTNVSDEPVKLSRVKASCGCTTPSYTKEAIAPGQTGEINVRYNSARIGAFNKSVTVYYDSAATPVVLRIRGKVEKPADQISYHHTMGGIAFDKINFNIPDLQRDQMYSEAFNIKNISPVEITFTEEMDVPGMFNVNIQQTKLAPGQTSKIILTAIGERWDQGGSFSKELTLNTDETQNAAKTLTITGNAAYSAAEKDKMPHIEFESLAYDGGTAIEGEKITYAYQFTNTGKSDLKIESVKASCGCTATAPKDEIIKPGESSEIVATFNSQGRVGQQRKTITVRTNDPDQPVVQLKLQVKVERDPFKVGHEGPAATQPGSGQ